METNNLKSYFMPSEVARLILGYLKENNYVSTYKCFLKECVHLTEYMAALKNGREYATTILGLSLILILEDYGKMKLTQVKTSDSIRQPKTYIRGATQASRMRKQLTDASKISPHKSSSNSHPAQQSHAITAATGNNSASVSVADTESVTGDGDHGRDSDPDEFTIDVVGCEGDATARTMSTSVMDTSTVSERSDTPTVLKVSHSLLVKSCLTDISNTTSDATDAEYCGHKDKDKLTDKDKSPKALVKTKISINKRNRALPEKQYKKTSIDNNISQDDSSKHKQNADSSNLPTVEKDSNLPSDSVADVTHKTVTSSANKKAPETKLNKETSDSQPTKIIDNGNKQDSTKTSVFPEKVNVKHEIRASSPDLVQGIPDDGSETASTKSSGSSSRSSDKARAALVDLDGNTCEAWASCHPGIQDGDSILDKLNLKPLAAITELDRPSDQEISQQLKTPRKKKEGKSIASTHLVTPIKLADQIKSPRRKKPKTPRKRPEVVPATAHDVEDPMFQKVLNDTKLIEKLTETCNIVNEKVKLSTSNKDAPPAPETRDTGPGHGEGAPDMVTGSRSLEEILDMDQNFTTELSSNIDMSDPAFESLFKLFGTDKEAFLDDAGRREHDQEAEQATAALTAEVEELERSIHEIACGNVLLCQKDEGYETQRTQCADSVASSPHTSAASLHASLTSTPGHPGASPYLSPGHSYSPAGHLDTHVLSPVQGGSHSLGSAPGCGQNIAYLPQPGVSGAIHETQMFSPGVAHSVSGDGHSFNFSASTPIASPSTPQSGEHCSQNYSHGGVPESPFSTVSDTLGAGNMSGYGTPHRPQHTPFPPSPLTTDTTNPRAFTGDYSLGIVRAVQTGSYTPASRRNILAASHDQVLPSQGHYPYSPGPVDTQLQSPLDLPGSAPVHIAGSPSTSHTHQSITQQSVNYMSFVKDVMSSGESSSTPIVGRATSTFASTIDNTIGCISLPPSIPVAPEMPPPVDKAGKGKPKRKKACDRQLLKQTVVSNANSQAFTELKMLLSKPSQSDLPSSGPSTPNINMSGPLTPDLGENEIMILSPGGNSCFKIPILGCQDENEIDQAVASIDTDVPDTEKSETVKLWTPNLNSSIEYSVVGENDSVSQITSQNGQMPILLEGIEHTLNSLPQTIVIVPETTQPEKGRKGRKSKKEKAAPKRTYTKKGKASQKEKAKKNEKCQPTQTAGDNVHPLLVADANEILTATPLLLGTSLHKQLHVRSLNFGSITTDVPSKNVKVKKSKFSNVTKTSQNMKVHLPVVMSDTVTNPNVNVPAPNPTTSVAVVDILSIKSIDTGQYVKITPKRAYTTPGGVKDSRRVAKDETVKVTDGNPSDTLLNNDNVELQTASKKELEFETDLELNNSTRTKSNVSLCDVNNKELADNVADIEKCDTLRVQSANKDTTKHILKKVKNVVQKSKVRSPKLNVKKSKVNYCPENSNLDSDLEINDEHLKTVTKKRVTSKIRKEQNQQVDPLMEESHKMSTSVHMTSPEKKTMLKKKRGQEKIKVKFTNKKETLAKNATNNIKLKPALKLKKHSEGDVNKKSVRNKRAAVTKSSSSGNSISVCGLKEKTIEAHSGENCSKDNIKKINGNDANIMSISQPSEFSSQESHTIHEEVESLRDSQDIPEALPQTPEKKQASNENDSDGDLFTPSKQSVFEKLGLTPKKDAEERAEKFQSPVRANLLDYLAEMRNTPKSARLRSPYRRKHVSSPSAPKQKTLGKQLFASDNNEGIKSPVNKKTPIDNTAKQRTPGKRLFVSTIDEGIKSPVLKTSTKHSVGSETPITTDKKMKRHTNKMVGTKNNTLVKRGSNKNKKAEQISDGIYTADLNKCENTENSDIHSHVSSVGTENKDALKRKPGFLKLVHSMAETPNPAASRDNVNDVTYTISPSDKVSNGSIELADGAAHCKVGESKQTGVSSNLAITSNTAKHKMKEHKARGKKQKQPKEKPNTANSNDRQCGIKLHIKHSGENQWQTVKSGCTADIKDTPTLSSCMKPDARVPATEGSTVPNERNIESIELVATKEKGFEKVKKKADTHLRSTKNRTASEQGNNINSTEIAKDLDNGSQKTATKRVKSSKVSRPSHVGKGTDNRTDPNHIGKLLSSPTKAEIRANARPNDKDINTGGEKSLTKDKNSRQNEGITLGQKRKCDDSALLEEQEPKKIKASVDMSRLSLDMKDLDVMKALSQFYKI